MSDLAAFVKEKGINRVVHVTEGKARHDALQRVAAFEICRCVVEDAHTVFERISGRIPLERLSPSWLIFSDGFSKSRFLLATKRAIDIVASLIGILLTLPIMGAVALAILIEIRQADFVSPEARGPERRSL